MKKRQRIGFIVVEHCEDWEQAMGLTEGEGLPPGGVLDWRDKKQPAIVFASFKDAKAAINRTEHYRLAWGEEQTPAGFLPEKKNCKVVPLEATVRAPEEAPKP